LVESVNNTNSAVAERFKGLVASFLATNGDAALATKQAWASLSGMLSKQAYVLAFADAFAIVAAVLAVSALLVLMLPSLRPKKSGDAETADAPTLLETANETGGRR
jgi:DHA2 family multidrug resistance protein